MPDTQHALRCDLQRGDLMRGQRRPKYVVTLIIQLTLTLLLIVIVPVLLGFWLDRVLQTSPFITLTLTVVGMSFGSLAIFRAVREVYERVEGDKP